MKRTMNDERETMNGMAGRSRRAHSSSSFIPAEGWPAAHPSSFSPSFSSRYAFTLTELLIVIGLLVLMMVLALPAVNFITGARSTESATNVISALLGSARSQAIARQSKVGILFFWDKTKEQTSAGLCSVAQPWDGTTNYVLGDVVEYPAQSGQFFYCTTSVVGTAPKPVTTIWTDVSASYKTDMPVLLDGYDLQTLPKGVGVQGVRNIAASGVTDRYISTACIWFDGEGRLSFSNYGLFLGVAPASGTGINWSRLGQALQMIDSGNNPIFTVLSGKIGTSQAAIVVYDHQAFKDAGFDEKDFVTGELGASFPMSEFNEEVALSAISVSDTANNPNGIPPLNTTFLLVNRYNGTLVKSE